MNHFALILTFLLAFWSGAGFAQTGMAVFGEVSIGENTTLVVAEDELTLHGDLTGEGEVRMAGPEEQTITAHDQAIDRLVVSNPKAVTVKGKLTIRKSVRVEQGDLIVAPRAELALLPPVQVRLAEGSKLIRLDAVFQPGKEAVSVEKQAVDRGEGLAQTALLPDETAQGRVVMQPIRRAEKPYRCPNLTTFPKPPWPGGFGLKV